MPEVIRGEVVGFSKKKKSVYRKETRLTAGRRGSAS